MDSSTRKDISLKPRSNMSNELLDPHGDETCLTHVRGGISAPTSAGSEGGVYGGYPANKIVVRSTVDVV